MKDQERDDRERATAATDDELDRVAAGSSLGQDGDDLLIWNNGDGSDFDRGGAGNDVLIGGRGNDVVL